MDPLIHFISTIIFIIVGFKYFNLCFLLAFFLSAAFLDADHFFYYLLKFKDLNIKKAFRFFESIRHQPKKAFCILHTIEFVLIIFLLTFILRIDFFYGFSAGLIFHLLIDLMQGIYYKRVNYRWWSILQYLSSH